MKTKLRKKLRKEAEKRYSIVVKGDLYMLYGRVEKKAYWNPPFWQYTYPSNDIDAMERILKRRKEGYIIYQISILKKKRELKRRGYL
jgi:hypothetical protein